MDKEEIFELVQRCIRKAANDFLNEKPIDHEGYHCIMEAVRILSHAAQLQRYKPSGAERNN